MRALNVRRGALASALLLALVLPVAHAAPGDETMLLDVCINDRCIGVAPVIARGDDVLVDTAALQAAALDTTGVVPEFVGERSFVSLRQLNHGSTYKIDRELLRLDLTLRADRLPRQRVAMATQQQSEVGLQPWSAFVNYATSVNQDGDGELFLDGAVGRGNAALRSGRAVGPVSSAGVAVCRASNSTSRRSRVAGPSATSSPSRAIRSAAAACSAASASSARSIPILTWSRSRSRIFPACSKARAPSRCFPTAC